MGYDEDGTYHPTDDEIEDQMIEESIENQEQERAEAESEARAAQSKPKTARKKRIRKPNMRTQLSRVTKKMERISIIAGEANEILAEIDDGIAVVEDLKKKLKEM
jgi:hypothetical protein